MPHFFAKSLDSCESVANRSGEYFDFILEAINPRDKSTLILAQNKSDSAQKIMLLKQQKNDKFLVKFNKHFKVQSREAIKNALKDYANLTNADIIVHNLNANKCEAQSQYLLDSRGILGLFGESKFTDCMIEIGFGSGRHILNLAQNNPNALIIGLEIYRPAILQVLRQIELLGLSNLYLASIDARVLFEVLPQKSLSTIFLHFPVPWDKNPQRRVFSEVFLSNAIATLKPQNGRFELITDSKEYFDFAKKLAKIYKHKVTINPKNAVVSKYEARWQRMQKKIYKLEIFPLVGNLFWGNHLRYFGDKISLNERLVLFRSFRAKITQSTTAITSIVIRLANQLRIKRESAIIRHCEANHRFAKAIQKNQSARSANPCKSFCYFWLLPKVESPLPLNLNLPIAQGAKKSRPIQSKQIVGVSKVAKMDSSRCRAQNDEFGVDCFGDESPRNDDKTTDCHESLRDSRNDGMVVDCHDSPLQNLAIANFGNDKTSLPQKICKKEYFLQIKDKYEFGDGFVIYVVFGAYYAPNSAYIIVRKNSKYCEILGDIIPTKANLSALNELQFLGVMLDN